MMAPAIENSHEERAVPVDLGVIWADGGPMPVLLQEGGTAFLVFHLAPIDPSGGDVGIIEWLGCSATSFGYPNDEALAGHRLWERGLSEIDGAAEVLNSSWIARMEVANRVHPKHDPARFAALRHFVLPFQDDTFECAAEGYRIETANESLGRVVERLAARLFDRYRNRRQTVAIA
jgi:hypothetical protein